MSEGCGSGSIVLSLFILDPIKIRIELTDPKRGERTQKNIVFYTFLDFSRIFFIKILTHGYFLFVNVLPNRFEWPKKSTS